MKSIAHLIRAKTCGNLRGFKNIGNIYRDLQILMIYKLQEEVISMLIYSFQYLAAKQQQ